MSKLNGSSGVMQQRQQTARDCMEMMDELSQKFPQGHINFYFIYTDSLYLNREESAGPLSKKVLFQMARHQDAFKKLNAQDVQYRSWNQAVLDANNGKVESVLDAIQKRYKNDPPFADCVRGDTLAAKRGEIPNNNDVAFILQELTVLEMLRRKETAADKTIIAYPGPPLKSDIYLREAKSLHPLGKAKPVSHSAFWADVSDKANIEMAEFALPHKEKTVAANENKKDKHWVVGLAACFAACVTFVADHPDTVRDEFYAASKPVISVKKDGMITMINKDTTIYFPDRSSLSRQIVLQDGKENAIDSRDEGQLAYEREIAVNDYLKRQLN